jgi:hydrogenase maturation protease
VSSDPRPAGPARVALIALGNRLRGDDALGPMIGERVVERLRRLDEPGVRRSLALHCGALDALAIVAAWSDARSAFVVDAALSGAGAGTLHRFEVTPPSHGNVTPLSHALARSSSHGLGLAEAIGLARALGRLPERLVCYAIEARAFGHAQTLSREVDDALEDCVARMADEILATWHDRPPLPRGACGD